MFGCLWSAVLVVLSVGVASSSVYPLPHPYHGCPRIHLWVGPYEYDANAVSSTSWDNSQGFGYANSLDYNTSEFLGCTSKFYDHVHRNCTQTTFTVTSIVCVYADNYCPTLTVHNSTDHNLDGNWTQRTNSTWVSESGTTGCRMTISGRDGDGKLTFACGPTYVPASQVTCSETHTLTPGLNTLHGFDVFLAASGHNLNVDTSNVKTLQLFSTLASKGQRLWLSSSNPMAIASAVVVSTISNQNSQPLVVFFNYVDEATALVRLETCHPPIGRQETINLMFVSKGTHKSDTNYVLTADTISVTEGTREVATFNPPMPSVPFVLTGLQSSTVPYMHTRVMGVTTDSAVVLAETATRPVVPPAASGVAGYAAMSLVGKTSGMFGPKWTYQVINGSSVVNTSTPIVFESPFAAAPFVFAVSTTDTSGPVVPRWSHISATKTTVELQSATCSGTPSMDAVDFEVLAVGPLPAIQTTTTTTTTTITTTTTTSSAGRLQVTSFGVMSMMWMLAMLRA